MAFSELYSEEQIEELINKSQKTDILLKALANQLKTNIDNIPNALETLFQNIETLKDN